MTNTTVYQITLTSIQDPNKVWIDYYNEISSVLFTLNEDTEDLLTSNYEISIKPIDFKDVPKSYEYYEDLQEGLR